ncbi:MAG: 4,5-DOPA dioxygenase extradiol [Synergistaceae bacterium]|nr:4,5-DOPA dioxygenase extradiol [Synergistaceae bacterium]
MKFPVIFSGHGDPMIALRNDDVTRGMRIIGGKVLADFGKPKAILAVSAHWYTDGTFIQSVESPEQIYDMYGFPQELYEVKYPVKGCAELSGRVRELLGDSVSVNNEWGIDHGTWTVLVHMFPDADIPVVQLSVSRKLSPGQCFEAGKKLSPLRNEGYLIFGSGNVVHNLRLVEWDNPDGTEETLTFNSYIIENIQARNYDAVIGYSSGPSAKYAVPTPEHYLPLVYCLGASDGDNVTVFNNVCNLGSMAMTGFAFGL